MIMKYSWIVGVVHVFISSGLLFAAAVQLSVLSNLELKAGKIHCLSKQK